MAYIFPSFFLSCFPNSLHRVIFCNPSGLRCNPSATHQVSIATHQIWYTFYMDLRTLTNATHPIEVATHPVWYTFYKGLRIMDQCNPSGPKCNPSGLVGFLQGSTYCGPMQPIRSGCTHPSDLWQPSPYYLIDFYSDHLQDHHHQHHVLQWSWTQRYHRLLPSWLFLSGMQLFTQGRQCSNPPPTTT